MYRLVKVSDGHNILYNHVKVVTVKLSIISMSYFQKINGNVFTGPIIVCINSISEMTTSARPMLNFGAWALILTETEGGRGALHK